MARNIDRPSSSRTSRSRSYAGQGDPARRTAKRKRPSKVTSARAFSYKVLARVQKEDCFLEEAWRHFPDGNRLPEHEKAFAYLLCREVVSRRGTLDELIDSVLSKPSDIQEPLRIALRISVCELLVLDKPAHVAVDQGVELVRTIEPKASRVANFVLRRIADMKPEFPFGDAASEIRPACAQTGFPLWFGEKLVDEWGHERAYTFMKRSNEPAPLFFMVNLARQNGPQTLKHLVSEGIKVVPYQQKGQVTPSFPLFVFAERKAVAHPKVERLLADGGLVISDAAAQCIASLAVPSTCPKRFLEIGAGRGTKSILLQNVALSRFGHQMPLETLDVDSRKQKERTARLQQAGIEEAASYCCDATDLSSFDNVFYDAVFIDAPCSGAGTLRRHPDARWRLRKEDIASFKETGLSLLKEAARLVEKDGQLTYATCTVFPEENREVVQEFLKSKRGSHFEIVGDFSSEELSSPEASGPIPDAHFACILRRIS